MKRHAFLISAFGNRNEQVSRLINNIRQYCDYDIYVITTENSHIRFPQSEPSEFKGKVVMEYVDRIWPKGSRREGIRNSNYYKVLYALDFGYNSVCLLDDDMLIVHKGFFEGFELAERFGAAVPINPRIYVGYNAMGADVTPDDLIDCMESPYYAPACNFSPFFYCNAKTSANLFMKELKNQLRNNVCRGTLAMWKASWQTGFTPILLPEQWCVCGSNAEHIRDYTKVLQGKNVRIPAMCLHLGHDAVRAAFAGYTKATVSKLLADWTLGQ